MKQSIKVVYDDGTNITAVVKTKDYVAFERHFGKALTDSNGSVEESLWLAWTAAFRSGQVTKDFDTWLEDVDVIENEATDADPKA